MSGSAPASFATSALARQLRRGRRRVVLGYTLLALAWIACSDAVVIALAGDLQQATYWQGLKGAFFIFASAAVIYHLLRPLGTHLLHAHQRLEDSEQQHRQVFLDNPGPILVYDLHSLRILDANPAACTLFRWERSALLEQTIEVLWPPGASAALEAKLAQLRAEPDQVCTFRTPMLLRDGSVRQMELRSNAVQFQRRPARLLIAIDRTAEDEALLRRDQALARLEEAHTLACIGAWELDPETGTGRYADQVYRLFGRRPPETRRWHRFEELLVAADPATAALTEQLLADMCSGQPVQVDVLLPLLASDGRAITVHLRARSGANDVAGQARVLGTVQDVTEREQSRRLLREREEQFRELVRVLPDGVVILSAGHVLYANAWAARLFGYAQHTLLGESLASLVSAPDLARVELWLQALPGEMPEQLQVTMQRPDGTRFQAGLAQGEVRYGGRDCRLLIVRDLSDSERTQAALATGNRELQAMAGRLFSLQEDERRAISRDLHDDIGQAITAMKLSAWAALDEDDPQRRNQDLQQIVSMADTTVAKLRDISTLLRPPQLDALGLEAALRWQAGVLFRSTSTELRAQIQSLPQRPDNDIEQACFRIAQESLTNALRHARASQVELSLLALDDHRLHLQIRDDGEGFDPDGPRGLGLIVMRERAQSVGGQLRIESAHGAGTLVDVHLPYQVPHGPNELPDP